MHIAAQVPSAPPGRKIVATLNGDEIFTRSMPAIIEDAQSHFLFTLLNTYNKRRTETELGRNLSVRLAQDSRVRGLEGKMIACGDGGGIFVRANLEQWYLWLAETKDQDTADRALEDFLNSTELEVMFTLWITGIAVDHTERLTRDVEIVPLNEMPLSQETKHLRAYQAPYRPFKTALPQAALVVRRRVPKIYVSTTNVATASERPGAQAQDKLYQTAFLLNALDGVCVQPSTQSSYVDGTTGFGPFGGGSGGAPHFDVTMLEGELSGPIDATMLQVLIDARTRTANPARIDLIGRRLAQAKRRSDWSDKLLDLGIAVEVMLIPDASRKHKTFKFSKRGAAFLASDPIERELMENTFWRLYDLRSQVAHGATVNKAELRQIRDSIDTFERLACEIFRKLVIEGEPDWTALGC